MKILNLQVDESIYNELLEILKNLPESKVKILKQDATNKFNFEQAMNYTLEKNKQLYERLS
ncbi:MAG: hypothetical protein KAH84_09465 [Thiomargarita sp.]|nr:hypothetical protein [Thiomargarita sp.]